MGRKQDQDAERAEPAKAEPSTPEPPGRVVMDSRGHNVWRWSREGNDSTSVVLKRLDNQDLALEPTQKVPIARGADPAAKGAAPKGAAPKSAAAKGMPSKGAPSKAAPSKGALPAKGKRSAANAETSKSSGFHPALQPDDERGGGGGGFDPYNSR